MCRAWRSMKKIYLYAFHAFPAAKAVLDRYFQLCNGFCP
ncbi:hypothetical protein GPB2148_2465 [marine gamma proteobacterium HTCC2148]|nr:hypothetical protein GPB2148_2465 [marine gamma proteobacterium HTCC2148]